MLLSTCAQDVWLFHSLTGSQWGDTTAINRFSSRNGRWERLPDAPFSPRADMLHHFVIDSQYVALYWAPPAERIVLLVIGGETGYACGNRHLGVCENDVWQLSIVRPPGNNKGGGVLELGLSFEWQRGRNRSGGEAVGRLPFTPRCGMAPLFEPRVDYEMHRISSVGGGQLSYKDTQQCTAPIVYSSEVWRAVWPYDAPNKQWRRVSDLPFSPRRSMQLEDAIVTNDEEYGMDFRDKAFTLAGGITYSAHRFDAVLNRSVTTRAEVHADAWTCNTDLEEGECDWRFTYPHGNLSQPGVAAPSGSLPVPVAFGASAAYPMGHSQANTRMGGAAPEAAMQAWRRMRLRVDEAQANSVRWRSEYNVSLMQQPNAFASQSLAPQPTLGELNVARYQLPLSYVVDEAELSSSTSAFSLGSDLLLTYTKPYWLSGLQPTFTSVESGVVTARRLGHATAGTWDSTIVSGGRSGDTYSSEWVSYQEAQCWWPEDPSYFGTLGAIRFVSLVTSGDRLFNYVRFWLAPGERALGDGFYVRADTLGAFHAADPVEVDCAAGWHFEPPLLPAADTAVLTCAATSEWVDVQLGGVRRCVRDREDCAWPLVDAGYSACVEPLPVLRSVAVYTSELNDARYENGQAASTDAVTVSGVYPSPISPRQLVLRGEWLTEPLDVTVGGHACTAQQLRNVSRHCSVSSTGETACQSYGQAVVCELEEASLGVRQSVVLTTGQGVRRRSISSIRLGEGVSGREVVTVSLAEPRVMLLRAQPETSCDPVSPDAPWRLTGCAMDGPLRVLVCSAGLELVYSRTGHFARATVAYAGAQVKAVGWEEADKGYVCGEFKLNGRAGVTASIALTSLTASGQLVQTNANQNHNASTAATIGFRMCEPGHKVEATVTDGVSTERCVTCPPGTSTMNTTGQSSCQPCTPGTYSNTSGAVDCLPCPVNSVSSTPGATSCDVCSGNRWQAHERQSQCVACKVGEFRVLAAAAAAPTSATNTSLSPAYSCAPCPAGAACDVEEGVLVAQAGSFLLIDQAVGVVSAVPCGEQACVSDAEACSVTEAGVDGTDDGMEQPAAQRDGPTPIVQRVTSSGLSVVNCCGAHRVRSSLSAVEPYVNVLCAECEAGYTELGGECVQCASTNWPALLGLLVAAFVLVWALHRLSSDRLSSATVPILAYAVQMSLLFQSARQLPSVLQLLQLDLLSQTRQCVLPLSGMGKLLARLLSPLLFVQLLGVLLLLQLSMRWAVERLPSNSTLLRRAYGVLFGIKQDMVAAVDGEAAAADQSTVDGVSAASSSRAKQLSERLLSDGERKADERKEQQQQEDDMSKSTAAAAAATTSFATTASLRPHRLPSSRAVLLSYRRTALRLLLYSYNAVCTACLAALDARAVGEYGWRLQQYASIDTAARQYTAVRPLFVALLVFPVLSGPVLLLAWLAWQRRQQLCGRQAGDKQQADGVEAAETASETVQPAAAGTVGAMLTASFRHGCWPMGAVMVARRLLLILILTFAGSGLWAWASMANTLVMFLHVLLWPYVRRADNALEAVGLLSLSLQTMLLAVPDESSSLHIWLWLLLLAPVAALFGLSVSERWQQQKLGKASERTPEAHAADVQKWAAGEKAGR